MFHVKHRWAAWGAQLGLPLQEAQTDRLEAFERLLLDRAVPLGMVSRGDAERLAERHILDSLRGATWIPEEASVLDLGSGAGLPGLALAIACPGASFVLGELRRTRAAFLELAVEALELRNVEVRTGDVRSLPDGSFDTVVARAFKDVTGCWAIASTLLTGSGSLIYWAGRSFAEGDLPPDVRATTHPPPSQLADAGPVVIMTRQ
jgi:16S rRNA (guanine527-N7)-methyltransferase